MFSVTCVAPINLALVKAWTTERDTDLCLPSTCTFGMALSTDEMCSKTTVAASAGFKENKMWFNIREVAFETNERLMRCIEAIQQLAVKNGNLKFPITWKLHIANQNTFPISCRLDTNAARYASIVFALARLYGLPPWEEISTIARLGCGLACRCLHGGFVHWYRGFRDDGLDCIAVPVVPAKHWPNMHVLILVVKGQLLHSRPLNLQGNLEILTRHTERIVADRIKQLTEAIKAHNFEKFADLTMSESRLLHRITSLADPAKNFMNAVSLAIVKFVDAYNETLNEKRVAFSFDLGPNAFLYLLEEHIPHFVAALKLAFPYDESGYSDYIKGLPIREDVNISPIPLIEKQPKNSIIFIIHTKIGEGAKPILEKDKSLLASNGLPPF